MKPSIVESDSQTLPSINELLIKAFPYQQRARSIQEDYYEFIMVIGNDSP